MPAARRRLIAMSLLAFLGLGGCRTPGTALRQRPAQRVELVLTVQGVTPEEERALAAELATQTGLCATPAGPEETPTRVLRLALSGHPDPRERRGLAATWAATVGAGALVGVAVPAQAGSVGLVVMPYTVGAGVVGGAVYGPISHIQGREALKAWGYLPWILQAEVTVLDRAAGGEEHTVAHRQVPILDLRPHLHPLAPEARTESAVRWENLQAALKALGPEWRSKP